MTEHRSLGFHPIVSFSPDGSEVVIGGLDGQWGRMTAEGFYSD